MHLENITLRLRPRGAYEATDLGVRMVQSNAAQVYAAWFVVVVPIMLVAMTLQTVQPWLPPLVIWWLKPLYDRVVLYVLSRRVFGDEVGIIEVAGAWRTWFGSGLIGALTWRRFEFTRAFSLPIFLLEHLGWNARRKRSALLQKNTRHKALLTQIAYLHIDAALYMSMLVVVVMLLPVHANLPVWSWVIGQDVPALWSVVTTLAYISALTLVEPLYVAAGFSLYLNRRIELEAWDLEVSLRRALAVGSKA